MNADERNAYDFGVKVVGTWDQHGIPNGWTIDGDYLAEDLPRWLRDQPVIYLADGPAFSVYLRGCYSDQMTRDRKFALLKIGGVDALMNAAGGVNGGTMKKKKPETDRFEAWAEKKWGASAFLHTSPTCGEREAFDAGWESGAAAERDRIMHVLDDHPSRWYFGI